MVQTILVVEDSAPVRGLVRFMLEQADYAVLEAANPQEALSAAQESRTGLDLAICDLHLPGGSGFETGDLLRGLFPAVKVLYMSGHDIGMPFSDGTGFILKPFRPDELLEKIRSMITAC